MPALFVEQLPQVVQTAGDGALVGVGVLQVLIRDVSAGQEGAFGLVQAALVHQDDSRVEISSCEQDGGAGGCRINTTLHSKLAPAPVVMHQLGDEVSLTGKCWTAPNGQFVIMQCLGETVILLQQQATETQI